MITNFMLYQKFPDTLLYSNQCSLWRQNISGIKFYGSFFAASILLFAPLVQIDFFDLIASFYISAIVILFTGRSQKVSITGTYVLYANRLAYNRILLKLKNEAPNCAYIVGTILYSSAHWYSNKLPNGFNESGIHKFFFLNSTAFISGDKIQLRHKNKLVPFNEYIPNKMALSFLEPFLFLRR